MDASELPKPDADDNVYGFFLELGGTDYSTPYKQKNTVIKYTKLPDYDFRTRVSWPAQQTYSLKPRIRRIITLGDDDLKANRSLRSNFAAPPKVMATNFTKRKIVTISEHDERDLHPKFTKERRSNSVVMSNQSLEADFKSEKQSSNRSTSRLTSSSKYTKETKTSAKTNNAYNKKEVNVTQQNYRGKYASSLSSENYKSKHTREREPLRSNTRSANQSRTILSKNYVAPSESDKEITDIRNLLYDNLKKTMQKPKVSAPPNKLNLKNICTPKKTLTIRVPLDEPFERAKVTELKSAALITPTYVKTVKTTRSRGSITDNFIELKDVKVGTNQTVTTDQITGIDDIEINTICKCESSVQTGSITEIFDSLEIPNVTLTKDRPEPREETPNVQSPPLPNLKVQSLPITPNKDDVSSSDRSYCQSASYIFSRATLTYTTRQKINFHVVGDDEEVNSKKLPSPVDYPISVVSVFKNELKNKQQNIRSDDTYNRNNNGDKYNCLNELNSLNCSYVFDKLMKPSDIISTIGVNNGLLQNDYICEQFQRELNFIDSFFESLQYLESCSLSEKCISDNKVESLVNNSMLFDSAFDIKNSEYDNFLSKLENGANIDDTETMASKSLFLLNLLIRDEQRRAKNLLFVLKMREDALKDFTKSQILWLEKKKKHDNTDISTLKKKQRGALLKLQHECGEMQRMRKALLTLSEKRKVALMKTKKNIELKLKNNVNVEQIILGKKKLKRSSSGDRNNSPLKCFDLSSSGCEESTTSKANSDTALVAPECPSLVSITSAEKCVQAGDALWTELQHQNSNVAAENFVAVDGGYLNILFHDLTLPQIFNSGKQYEVNEEKLKNIVNSTNNNNNNNLTGSEVVDKLMEQIKNRELDTSSPSTARSLVEEFDQYYRGLVEEDKSVSTSTDGERECSNTKVKVDQKDSGTLTEIQWEPSEECSRQSIGTMSVNEDNILSDMNVLDSSKVCICESVISVNNECSVIKEPVSCASQPQTGPLPVPVGAAAVVDTPPPDVPKWLVPKSSESTSTDSESVSSQSLNVSTSSLTTLSTPVQCEAEELRRQQIAIEREIKALEQQQSRLLVVREIPDKPPPPYTPPTENKPKPPRMFALDKSTENIIEEHLTNPTSVKSDESKDAFDAFLKDSCQEFLERHKQEQSDKPWDACNLLPQKPQVDLEKLVQNTFVEMKEVLTSVAPTVVSGVSSRRSDHIDDILFTEWRRCEPEWTTLNNDEVIVKNQIFESIFQKILTETVDEYKKTVSTHVIRD